MVGTQRNSRGSKGLFNPQTLAAIDSCPPTGYKSPPTLIGFKTIEESVIKHRVSNYKKAYKIISGELWNEYVALGIQDFESPTEYFSNKARSSTETENLRLARYYRNHLKHNKKVDAFLLATIATVETQLAEDHPEFFDMPLEGMDEYLSNLNVPKGQAKTDEDDDLSMEIDKQQSTLATAAAKRTDTVVEPKTLDDPVLLSPAPPITQEPTTTDDTNQTVAQPSPPLEEDKSFTPVRKNKKKKKPKKHAKSDSISADDFNDKASPDTTTAEIASPPRLNKVPLNVKRPSKITKSIIRIEARWGPKDFNELRYSTTKMHARLAPILSCLNNDNTWITEWQTDQMPESPDLDPGKLSQYLSIRVIPVAKDQCFYFSFRVHGSGVHLTNTFMSDIFVVAKRGENLHLDTSTVPSSQGELTYIGDILLKDASVTHRGQYMQYLRKEVLPEDTPLFDLKFRRTNPTGSKINILTVRCGKSKATQLSEVFSTALSGETGTQREIFISRIALGANQTSRGDHERIYAVQNAYLADVSHLLFSASAAIDTPVTEYLESGETVTRSPRQWAKSLVFPNGESLEVDLEYGGAFESRAVLVVPSVSLRIAKTELHNYWTRRNPALSHATKLYRASVVSHPDIPKTVFTKNIDTILAKRIKRCTGEATDDSSTALSPLSSLTDGANVVTAAAKGSIAWRQPLQDTLLSKEKAAKAPPKLSSLEINQQKKIAILEAQLAIRSGNNSVASNVSNMSNKSAKSKTSRSSTQSGQTASSAHSRVDKLESQMTAEFAELKKMIQNLTMANKAPVESPTQPVSCTALVPLDQDPLWAKSARETESVSLGSDEEDSQHSEDGHGMKGIKLFQNNTELTLLESPKKAAAKRNKPSTPTKPTSNLSSLQYKDTGASGGDPC